MNNLTPERKAKLDKIKNILLNRDPFTDTITCTLRLTDGTSVEGHCSALETVTGEQPHETARRRAEEKINVN
jgi:hypothetical protein